MLKPVSLHQAQANDAKRLCLWTSLCHWGYHRVC